MGGGSGPRQKFPRCAAFGPGPCPLFGRLGGGGGPGGGGDNYHVQATGYMFSGKSNFSHFRVLFSKFQSRASVVGLTHLLSTLRRAGRSNEYTPRAKSYEFRGHPAFPCSFQTTARGTPPHTRLVLLDCVHAGGQLRGSSRECRGVGKMGPKFEWRRPTTWHDSASDISDSDETRCRWRFFMRWGRILCSGRIWDPTLAQVRANWGRLRPGLVGDPPSDIGLASKP